jgi:hypothetical protein
METTQKTSLATSKMGLKPGCQRLPATRWINPTAITDPYRKGIAGARKKLHNKLHWSNLFLINLFFNQKSTTMTKKSLIITGICVLVFLLIFIPLATVPADSSPYDYGYAVGKYSANFLQKGFLFFSLGYFVYRYTIRRKPL